MSQHKIAYVVPTKDRPADMRKLLDSLATQTRLPEQIVVVDGSDDPIETLCREYTALPINYVRVRPPSLARQRNAGMAALRPEITVAGYLDDDLVLEADATEKMVSFWETAPPETGGVSFSIINQPRGRNRKWPQRLLGMQHPSIGRVLPTGFASDIPYVKETVQTEWLYGGATIWSRAVITNFDYDEWYVGHGYLEDVDYSYRVSRTHTLYVCGDARVWHFSRPMNPARNYDFGRQQIFNRIYFARKVGLPWWGIAYGVATQLLVNGARCVLKPGQPAWDMLRGNLVGFAAFLAGRTAPYVATYK